MELLYKTSKVRFLAAVIGLLGITSCKDDLPKPLDTESNVTILSAIKLVNAGANGTTVLQGTVNEDEKTVNFPRIEPETDFSKLRFEAVTSTGAKLDKETYAVTFEEGQTEKVMVLKVVNSPRFREYLVRLRLKVPVFGADFDTYATYDFSNNPLGQPPYDAFTGQVTRGSGFDGQYVFVAHRTAPHLLKVSDLTAGAINKIQLNVTGAPSIYSGTLVNGHVYAAGLSGSTQGSGLKVVHWNSANPSAVPDLIINQTTAVAGAGSTRYGDNISASLDDQGNGYLFFGNNGANGGSVPGTILRYTVSNYTTISNPVAFPAPLGAGGSWITYNRIGNTSEYLFTGHSAQLALANDAGSSTFTTTKMTALASGTTFPITSSDARIVSFNSERYLIVVTAPIGANAFSNLRVYNITKGTTIKDALTNLNDLPVITPIFDYSLMGPIVNAAAVVQSGFYVKKDAQGKDEKLMLYAATVDGGFAFFEFGKKVASDI